MRRQCFIRDEIDVVKDHTFSVGCIESDIEEQTSIELARGALFHDNVLGVFWQEVTHIPQKYAKMIVPVSKWYDNRDV